MALLHIEQGADGRRPAPPREDGVGSRVHALAPGRPLPRGFFQGAEREPPEEHEHGEKACPEPCPDLQEQKLPEDPHVPYYVQLPDESRAFTCGYRQKLISVPHIHSLLQKGTSISIV